MKKRKLIIAAGLILIAGLLLYFSKAISLNTIFKAKSAESSKIQSSEHQGHTGGGISQQQTAAQEQTPEEPPTVEIPTDKQQLIGVKTVEVSVKPLQKIIRTVGRIEYDERRLFTVNTKFEGWIEKLYVDYTGRYVKKGEPLAEGLREVTMGLKAGEKVASSATFLIDSKAKLKNIAPLGGHKH